MPLAYIPRGYIGRDHETLGSDILSVTRVLKMPVHVLGPELAGRLSDVRADQWYPIGLLIDIMERMEASVGPFGLIRMGRELFDLSHKEHVKKVASSARDILYSFDGLYRAVNRGIGIGGWKVVSFQPGEALMEKTTPHHCMMEQGIMTAALAAVGCTSNIEQKQCLRQGAGSCIFRVTSMFTDHRWDGPKV